MKWSTFNYISCLLCFTFLLCPEARAQAAPAETFETVETIEATEVFETMETVEETENKYDKRVHRYREKWSDLIPTHFKLQYAGNMGLLSVGTGWDYGKRNQWETDVLFGFLPKYSSKRAKMTFTLKQNYIPWSYSLKHNLSLEPLSCGMYLNTVFGNEFWTKEPDRYPKGYYGFSSKVRIHVFLGQRLTYEFKNREKFSHYRSVTFFYELSTCDLYLVSAVGNSYLRPSDYLSLSFGVKLQVF